VRDLGRAFDEEDETALAQAYLRLSSFYDLPFPPGVRLAARVGTQREAGFCRPSGHIVLTRPDVWKRNRRWNTRELWVEVALHEFGHYVFFAQAEPKANWFASQVLKRAGKSWVKAPKDLTARRKSR
jgi:hypothetical protein